MTILDRYIIKEFLRFFFLVFVSLLSLSILIDFFEKIRMFLSNNASLDHMFRYFLAALPMLISLIIPATVLLAALMTFGSLSRYQEVTAIKANGISLYRTSLPIIIIATFLSVIYFLFGEFVTPFAKEKADHIIRVEVQKQPPLGTFIKNELWYRGKEGIYNFRLFEPSTGTLFGVTINQVDEGFNLVRRIDAKKAVWKDGLWHFHNLLITKFAPGKESIPQWVNEMVLNLPETPSDFKQVQKRTDQMGYFELREYIDKIRSEGYDSTSYEVDMHGKAAFSFANIILAIIGLAFSLKTERSGALARSIGVGILVGFSYWIVFALSISFGRSGSIPPLLAAWITNGLFGIGALYLFARVKT